MPPLAPDDNAPDALPPHARHALTAAMLLAHVVAGWALLQIEPVRRAVGEVAPVMVDWIAPPVPPAPPPPPPPPAPPAPKPPPKPRPVIVSAPAPAPAPPVFVVPAPPPELPPPAPPAPPEPMPAPRAPVVAATPPAPPPPALPPAPKTIAINAVEYLMPPVLDYPRASRRMQEQGRVHVRVLVDADGRPQEATVIRSSGHARLDEAALATVRATRFKPYRENGTPLPFRVVMPLVFELE